MPSTAGYDAFISYSRRAPTDLVRGICATAGGTLTGAQWDQYAGTSPPAVMPCAR